MMITQSQINGIASEFATAREKWLRFWLSQLLPPVCIKWVDERRNLEAVARYMEKQRIHLRKQCGDSVEWLMKGETRIASFEIKFRR
jgi:hypothetical protein